jgi:hypothetical protein
MKINELINIGTKENPIMEEITRDMTPEEEAEFLASFLQSEPTQEERLKALESAMLDLILGGDTNV